MGSQAQAMGAKDPSNPEKTSATQSPQRSVQDELKRIEQALEKVEQQYEDVLAKVQQYEAECLNLVAKIKAETNSTFQDALQENLATHMATQQSLRRHLNRTEAKILVFTTERETLIKSMVASPGDAPKSGANVVKYNGYVLVETTTRALVGQKTGKMWVLDSSSAIWQELVLKLLRAERAIRYFHSREGFEAVKHFILDTPSFAHFKQGAKKQDFNEFFDWFFDQELPDPVPATVRGGTMDEHLDSVKGLSLGFVAEHGFAAEIPQLRTFLAQLCHDPLLTAEHSSSTKYLSHKGYFWWGQEQLALADTFGLSMLANDYAPTLEIDYIVKIHSSVFGERTISPPQSPLANWADLMQEKASDNPPPNLVLTQPAVSISKSKAKLTFKQCLPGLYEFYQKKRFHPYVRQLTRGYTQPKITDLAETDYSRASSTGEKRQETKS